MDIKQGKVSSVAALNNRTDLSFVSDSQDVDAVRDHFGLDWAGREYDAYFVACSEGEYTEVWGMCGTVPYLPVCSGREPERSGEYPP